MTIIEFPIERTPAGKVIKLTRQVELMLREKCVTDVLIASLERLADRRRELENSPQDYFRRDQVEPTR